MRTLLAPLRVFFTFLFGTAGIIISIVLMIAFIGIISGSSDGSPEINYTYSLEVLPNADGVRKILSSDTPVILRLNFNGVIGIEELTRTAIDKQLVESRERALKNNRVKALLLYIDSPGGTVTDSDGIYRAIKSYKEKYKTPVYAFVNGLCASGGMYIACAADKIYASNVSLIGSVGVILPSLFNISQLMEKVGVQALTIYDGKGKDNLNPLRPWKKGEEDNIKEAISHYYDMFVNIIVSNRKQIEKLKLIKDYGADVYPASIAKEYGYIDATDSSLSEVIQNLAQAIGTKDDNYQVMELQNKTWSSMLFGSGKGSFLSGRMTHHIELTPEINSKLMNQYLYMYQPQF